MDTVFPYCKIMTRMGKMLYLRKKDFEGEMLNIYLRGLALGHERRRGSVL